VAREVAYGCVGAITAADRIPAVSLAIRHQRAAVERRDKTGSRTFGGLPPGGRRQTSFDLKTYLTSWSDPAGEPAYGALVQAAMGADALRFAGATAAVGCTATRLAFAAPHGLVPGQAVECGGEIRFVTAVMDTSNVQLSAPLTAAPAAGTAIGPAVTYVPSTCLPSISIFDYWEPTTAVQRILSGAAVDRMTVQVNADYHEMAFSGMAQDLIDNLTFSGDAGELTAFPAEPAPELFDYSVVPGNLGQAWLGTAPDRFYTVLSATLTVNNNLDLRAREFGSALPQAVAPGKRSITLDFDLLGKDDDASKALYQAARQVSPVSVMLQLGEQAGQLMGVYLKSVMPEAPEFDDSESRLAWRFRGAQAQGTADDEIAVAFA
jgi:hypothetical protein